jgi:hypothetical protein
MVRARRSLACRLLITTLLSRGLNDASGRCLSGCGDCSGSYTFLFPLFEKQYNQPKQALIVAYIPKQIMGNE